jgi:hypothetical protein
MMPLANELSGLAIAAAIHGSRSAAFCWRMISWKRSTKSRAGSLRRTASQKASFVGLGRRLDLKEILCPLYLLAGESDDITTSEQVFAAENLVGTRKGRIEKKLVPGGHIGFFMVSRTLKETWPTIAQWLTHSGAA